MINKISSIKTFKQLARIRTNKAKFINIELEFIRLMRHALDPREAI